MSDADLVKELRGFIVNETDYGQCLTMAIDASHVKDAADRIEALAGEVERLREICGEAADLIKRQQGWQEYGEKLERSADAEMAAEIQDQRKKNCALRGEIEALMHARAAWKSRAESAERALADYARHEQTLRDNGIPSHSHAVVMICDLRRALADAIEIMRRIDADFSGPRVTVHDGNAFSHFQELNRQAVAIRTAARDFITAQEKEKGSNA